MYAWLCKSKNIPAVLSVDMVKENRQSKYLSWSILGKMSNSFTFNFIFHLLVSCWDQEITHNTNGSANLVKFHSSNLASTLIFSCYLLTSYRAKLKGPVCICLFCWSLFHFHMAPCPIFFLFSPSWKSSKNKLSHWTIMTIYSGGQNTVGCLKAYCKLYLLNLCLNQWIIRVAINFKMQMCNGLPVLFCFKYPLSSVLLVLES